MDNRTPRDKLLQASGIKKPVLPEQELRGLRDELFGRIDVMVSRAENADSSAQETQRILNQMIQRLEKFGDEKLPAQMAHALETMAQNDLSAALQPLKAGVAKATHEIEICHSDLARMSWDMRLLVGPFIAGMVTAVIAAGMMRCTLSGPVKEAARFELLGRTVEKRIALHTPEDQQKIHNWINGIKPAEPKRASRKGR